jgi:hypothetical protein
MAARDYEPIIPPERGSMPSERRRIGRASSNAHFNRLFQLLTREGSEDQNGVGLWCRRCCTIVLRGAEHSLTKAGYLHLADHARSEALMRLKEQGLDGRQDKED